MAALTQLQGAFSMDGRTLLWMKNSSGKALDQGMARLPGRAFSSSTTQYDGCNHRPYKISAIRIAAESTCIAFIKRWIRSLEVAFM